MLTPEQQRFLEERAAAEERNPVLFFKPNPCKNCGKRYSNPECAEHRIGQHDFLKAHSYITAAFAGNQFGKTTALICKAFIQHLPTEALPKALQPYKFVDHSDPVVGWVVCPSERAAVNYVIPALRQWAPKDFLHGNSFDKAWAKQDSILRFKDGGRIHLFTYQQEPDKFVGAQVDYVGFDEPPPQPIFNECSVRVIKRKGRLFFTMTPVNMTGGGIGWIYRDIWKKREDPDITVVRGSIHDNPHLPEAEVKRFLNAHQADPDLAAREYGEFVHVGGMIYPGGFERCLVHPPSTEHVQGLEVVVGIDPGLKNASFVWIGFDNDNSALVFDEVRLNEKTPVDYARAIHAVNKKWGIRNPLYVIDPSARNRNLVNRENVQAELQRHGIPCIPGQNAVQAGIQQIRRRIEAKSFLVSTTCRVLRDEAEEYRMQDRPDGEFAVVKEKDHALDACFVAGTLIETESGPKTIESVEVGARVWTREGLKPVLAARMTNPDAEVFRLGPLVGTADHPVWTDNRGWVGLNAIRYDDILRGWNSSSIKAADIAGIPTRTADLIASTSSAHLPGGVTSTGTSSRTTVGRFRMGGTSTTATATRSTTIWTTLSAFLPPPTRGSTGRLSVRSGTAGTQRAFATSQRLGTHLKRAASGIANMVARPCSAFGPLSVNSAASSSTLRQFGPTFASARTSASPLGAGRPVLMTSKESASSAETSSVSTSTPRRSAAPANAVASRRAGRSAVYNLTVEDCPEYFANGVLVHNCRYGLMSRPFYAWPEEDKQPLGWDIENNTVSHPGKWLRRAPNTGPLGSWV